MSDKKEDLAEVKNQDGLVVGFVDLGTKHSIESGTLRADGKILYDIITTTESSSGGFSSERDPDYVFEPAEKVGKDAGLHECNIPKETEVSSMWGCAVDNCWERQDETLWSGNGEYDNQVNFCPFCGYEAKVKIGQKEDEEVGDG